MASPSQETLDRITKIAARALDVPVACVSTVDAGRRFHVSSCGLSASIALLTAYSFWRCVVGAGRPLVVPDGREHPLLAQTHVVLEGTVRAYLGMPLVGPDGDTAGVLFAMDVVPRQWTQAQVEFLAELAAVIAGEMEGMPPVASARLQQLEGSARR